MKKIALIILSALLVASPVSAIPDDETLDIYDINGIYYYDGSACLPNESAPTGDHITWIGDSYTAEAEDDFHLISDGLPGTDLGPKDSPYYQVSKHIAMDGGPGNAGGTSGLNILKNIKSQDKLRDYLVFALGTNDADYGVNGQLETQLNILLDSEHAGDKTNVILVTPRTNEGGSANSAYDSMSEIMRKYAETHSTVLVADWNQVSNGHPEYFSSDNVHPSEEGIKVWFDTIKNSLPKNFNGNSELEATSLPAETVQYFEADNVKQKVEANMERYKYGEQETGLPWQILATLHYREGGLGSNQSISNGEELYDHTNVDGVHISSDPNQDAKDSANGFIEAAKSVYGVDVLKNPTLENYAMGFLAYNRGFMYKAAGATWDQSPYVMNGYDAEHMNMRWLHADSYYNGQKLNDVEGLINKVPGTLAMLAYLGGVSSQLSGNCPGDIIGEGASAIAQMAVNMSWPFLDGSDYGKCVDENGSLISYYYNGGSDVACHNNPRPLYAEKCDEYGLCNDYPGYSTYNKRYKDCGWFVGTVLATALPDEKDAIIAAASGGTSGTGAYMAESDLWEPVENIGTSENLQPGDVLVNGDHIIIFVGDYGKEFGVFAHASADQRPGSIGPESSATPSAGQFRSYTGAPFEIYRHK